MLNLQKQKGIQITLYINAQVCMYRDLIQKRRDEENDVGNLLWMESSRVFQLTNNEMVCAYGNDRKMRSISIKTQRKVRKVKFAKLLLLGCN